MRTIVVVGLAAIASGMIPCRAQAPTAADVLVSDADVYTADAQRAMAQAFAIKEGKIVFVGGAAEARAWVGPHTRVVSMGGRLILPGLIDSHVHPLDIVEFDVCSLHSRPQETLSDLSAYVRRCAARYRPAAGEWLKVFQWNYAAGNRPDAQFATLRAALDAAAPRNPVELFGNDGHHGAYNSAGLALAKNSGGQRVGMSRETLATDFAPFAKLIGVDAGGDPNGAVNEDARNRLDASSAVYLHLDLVLKEPQRITERLAAAGITGILDAMVAPEGLQVYERLLARQQMTVRANLALFYEPEAHRDAAGRVDYDSMVDDAKAIRARYAAQPLLQADTVKIFADGGLEGNPYADPPTLPDSPSLNPYLQPIFGKDSSGRLAVTGYADPESQSCREFRAAPAAFSAPQAIAAFRRRNGFHPGQCAISSGMPQHEPGVMLEYAKRFHQAGFNLHIHAIGDAAVRIAVDAIEQARASDGNSSTRDGIAHLQLGHPDDIARIGRDQLYIAYTYAWITVEPEYDMSVIPFIQKVSGNRYESLHPPSSYYESNVYPVRSSMQAGAVLVAGSDAPVDTPDPRPFVNMSGAVTRALPGGPALNPAQAITIRDVIDAYTINGARFLGRQAVAGSIEVGKSADFIVLDRDILRLADRHRATDIRNTGVLETWFMGNRIYVRAARKSTAKRGLKT